VGNRTDAMWWDGDTDVWVGCGSTVIGTGLYVSTDQGESWFAPATTDDTMVESFRVSSIQRADDGLLYIGGIHVNGTERVLSLDTSVDPMTVAVEFTSGGQTWNTFHVGSFRRNSEGVAVAESLTGTGLVYRVADDQPWQDGAGWAGGSSLQVLDLVEQQGKFYGCGSTISEPPRVYLPGGDDPFAMAVVQLAAWDGEMWGLDADSAGNLIVAGVNQQTNQGAVFSNIGDPYDNSSWVELDVSTVVGDSVTTWMRGGCRNGARLLAVGEYSQTENPLALFSNDSGGTWTDITADLAGSPAALHRCKIFDDGRLAITGMDGWFGMWR
jgi:hypothetical protein